MSARYCLTLLTPPLAFLAFFAPHVLVSLLIFACFGFLFFWFDRLCSTLTLSLQRTVRKQRRTSLFTSQSNTSFLYGLAGLTAQKDRIARSFVPRTPSNLVTLGLLLSALCAICGFFWKPLDLTGFSLHLHMIGAVVSVSCHLICLMLLAGFAKIVHSTPDFHQ